VASNKGYKYTTDAPLSSTLANKLMTEATLQMLDKNAVTIIDIGAGDGTYSKDILNARPDAKITGFDPASEAIKMAAEKYPDIEFSVGNILEPDTFPKKRYDAGVIRGVLHHLKDPQLAIKNSGMLADRVIIIEPNGNNPILKLIEKVSPYHREHEERSFSSSLLKKWCEESGFEVEKIDFIGFVPFFFPTFLTKIIYFFQPMMEKIYPLKKYFGAQIVIRCKKK
jgi:2-polyprenyl-3-methyl-5-hydroxy-6-metoxy-1,4-benzoquinol methylase